VTAAWFGRYRIEVAEELREFVVRAFVEPAEPGQRDAVRAEVLHELEGAAFVLEPDGTFISESHGIVLLRSRIPLTAFDSERLTFEKAPGATVELELIEEATIISRQPGKPAMIFRRVSNEN
jgi:hypothetical protein